MSRLKDKFTIGSNVICADDTDLRGEISIGSGTVIHPKVTIVATQGPIVIGSGCIIEDGATIVNRQRAVMRIGDNNLFEVLCRIESPRIGSFNTFEARSRTAQIVSVGSYCTIGAGCFLTSSATAGLSSEDAVAVAEVPESAGSADSAPGSPLTTGAASSAAVEVLEDMTVVYGAEAKRRTWSGNGMKQAQALHAKHLEYLRDTLPRHIELRDWDEEE
ncbi:unnamed protein product [Tilletia controversa]|uniref:Dynactin subunit 6 n=2 Tax=Tilletia TaxID=13289 RepID=A0A8X7SYQ4_9BASI|nr:hypothetical protein CF336_g5379 [Tilletia laevis]KAE8196084.1 hypothetical protein CF328_g4242 [Tilletia controversa]KAE8257543.1 hypothetical protein A4X03_0g4637 [Tilletia caries]KAE8197429.1 hypothetical protein CF335_g4617 [Tilletia laevis]KAE8251033.1 hypothetical protein A4X06_0g2843 [Tilletia controversa]